MDPFDEMMAWFSHKTYGVCHCPFCWQGRKRDAELAKDMQDLSDDLAIDDLLGQHFYPEES